MRQIRFFAPVVALALASVLAACSSGSSTSASESPAPVPASSPSPTAVSTGTKVSGVATAGPVCPVEKPGDPACAPRPVAGAVLIVTELNGTEIARATTGSDGRFTVNLPAGAYTLVPQRVEGLMGTAPPIPFSVGVDGAPSAAPLEVQYDTGIR